MHHSKGAIHGRTCLFRVDPLGFERGRKRPAHGEEKGGEKSPGKKKKHPPFFGKKKTRGGPRGIASKEKNPVPRLKEKGRIRPSDVKDHHKYPSCRKRESRLFRNRTGGKSRKKGGKESRCSDGRGRKVTDAGENGLWEKNVSMVVFLRKKRDICWAYSKSECQWKENEERKGTGGAGRGNGGCHSCDCAKPLLKGVI